MIRPEEGQGARNEKVVKIGRRRDRDETFDLWPAHQKLHADPGAERGSRRSSSCAPRVDGLRPVKRKRRHPTIADAVIEAALAPADAAEVEAQRGKAAVHEGIVKSDRRSHGSSCRRIADAEWSHDADRRVFFAAPGGTGLRCGLQVP